MTKVATDYGQSICINEPGALTDVWLTIEEAEQCYRELGELLAVRRIKELDDGREPAP